MPFLLVPIENAVPIYGPVGKQITLINQDAANDCWIDQNPNRLNGAFVGSVGNSNGTKIAKGGGQIQVDSFRGKWYARANVAMQLEVQY